MSVEPTLQAALTLTARLRSAGVVGMPGVRVKGSGDRFELVVEDRPEPGDSINEARGIRFYLDDATSRTLGKVTLDADGDEFVLRQT